MIPPVYNRDDLAKTVKPDEPEQTILTAEQRKSNLYFFIVSVITGALLSLAVNYVVENRQQGSSDKSSRNSESALEVQVRNVIGGPEPETFYEIAGKRAYLNLDGKPVEEYIIPRPH
mgnify:CR=1 FL=1